MSDIAILVAALDAVGRPAHRTGPDGQTYPVLRPAPASPLTERISEAARTTFMAQALRLNRLARQLAGEEFDAPVYLYLSDEDGGFARHGFWLSDDEERFIPGGYINMVVAEFHLERGHFESTFTHELGHLMLRTLVGEIPDGPAAGKMHQSMTVTDYPTAFDEAWSEHFELLVVDRSVNPWLLGHRQRARGADVIGTWLSEIDTHLLQAGARRNWFIHAKALPESALEVEFDPYRVWLEGETGSAFLTDRLRTGQAMLSSEGVGATLFYRIVTSEALQNGWREPAFYSPFLGPGADPQVEFSPYENINLKLFVAMRHLARRPLDPHRPLLLDLIVTYAALFPEEADLIYKIFLDTTWGATASREVAAALETLAYAGRTGNLAAFQEAIGGAFDQLDRLRAEVLAGAVTPDANVGPELWVENREFLVPASLFRGDRTNPLRVNLNTASESELMTFPGVDLQLARAVVTRRRELGFFPDLDALRTVPGMIEQVLARILAGVH